MNEITESILKKAARGDMAAFETLVLHYEKLIYSIAYRMFSSHEDAKDMLQDVFVKVFINIKTCKDFKQFKSWICTIATRTCIDELRRRKGKATESLDRVPEDESGGGRLASYEAKNQETPEEAAISAETWQELEQAVGMLSEEERMLVILRDIEGFSYAEVAEAAGLPLGTLKSKLFRARAKLRTFIRAEQNKIIVQNFVDERPVGQQRRLYPFGILDAVGHVFLLLFYLIVKTKRVFGLPLQLRSCLV